MSPRNINGMSFGELRTALHETTKELTELQDEFARFKRDITDILENLDDSNFSTSLLREKSNMKTQISVTAEGIKTKVSNEDLEKALTNYSTITQTAEAITATVTSEYVNTLIGDTYVTNAVLSSTIQQTADSIELSVSNTYQTKDDAEDDYNTLSSAITVEEGRITSIISGTYTDDILNNYLTGIEITQNGIKMLDDSVYSVYNSDGLRFYDSMNQTEGWAIEPSQYYGGVLNYYVNNVNCYRFGTGETGSGYSSTDMVIKAITQNRNRFVVDVTNSGNQEVKFVGLNEADEYSPYIYANEQLLATQEWVKNNGLSNIAVFG